MYLTILFSIICRASPDPENLPTEDIRPNRLTSGFSRELGTQRWQSRLVLDKNLGRETNITFDESITIWLHSIPGYKRQWKIDQGLNLSAVKQVNNLFDWKMTGEYKRFIDQRAQRFEDDSRPFSLLPLDPGSLVLPGGFFSMSEGKIQNWHVGIGGEYRFDDRWKIDGTIGPFVEDRAGFHFQGTRLAVDIQESSAPGDLNMEGWHNWLSSGNNYGWSASFFGDYGFSEGGRDVISLAVSGSRLRELSPLRNALNRRNDEQIYFENRLSSAASTSWRMEWDTELTRSLSAHSTEEQGYRNLELVWKNDIRSLWNISTFSGQVNSGVDMQHQEYSGGLLQGRRIHLGTVFNWRQTPHDSTTLEARAIRYRFDTPQENDLNDRDELRYLVALETRRKLTPEFGVNIRLEADLNHMVYLFRPRSSQNRWTRLFTLSCDLPWRDDPLENYARFSVMSNYSDYDYPPAENTLSRAYRSFNASDSLRLKLNRRLSLEIKLSALVDDHGRLLWHDWVEEVAEDGYGYGGSVLPTWEIADFSIGVGWSVYHRHTRIHHDMGSTTPGEGVRSQGLLLAVSSPEDKRLRGTLGGSILRVKDRLRGNYRLPDVQMQITWIL